MRACRIGGCPTSGTARSRPTFGAQQDPRAGEPLWLAGAARARSRGPCTPTGRVAAGGRPRSPPRPSGRSSNVRAGFRRRRAGQGEGAKSPLVRMCEAASLNGSRPTPGCRCRPTSSGCAAATRAIATMTRCCSHVGRVRSRRRPRRCTSPTHGYRLLHIRQQTEDGTALRRVRPALSRWGRFQAGLTTSKPVLAVSDSMAATLAHDG